MLYAEKNSTDLQLRASLGWVQFKNGKVKEAEESLLQAASTSAVDGETLYFLAQVLLANGKAKEASPVLVALRNAVLSPKVFLQRDAARKWLDSVAFALE
jgi:Flp pilus assembly protein TadD